MKCTVLQENIIKNIQDASKFVATKSQLQTLYGIHVKAIKGGVVLETTDAKMGFQTKMGGKVEKEGECVVSAKVLLEVIHALEAGPIVFELKEKNLHIQQKQLKSSLQTFPIEDFPPFTEPVGKLQELPFEVFRSLIDQVSFCASVDETRPVLTSMLLEFSETTVSCVCTDGYRLAVATSALKETIESERVLLSAKVLSEVVRMFGRLTPETIRFYCSQELAQVSFNVGDTTVFMRTVEGDFPPYQTIIPTSFSLKTMMDKEEWMHALKIASIFSKETSSILTLVLEGSVCHVKAASTAIGEHEGDVSLVNPVLETKTISFNSRFLMDALSHVPTDTVEFCMNDELKPVVLKSPEQEESVFVVMPFKR